MIEIIIKIDGEKILDRLNNKNCTLEETALVLYRLEQIKKDLLEKEFESDFEVRVDEE